jgi:hypothetical protein
MSVRDVLKNEPVIVASVVRYVTFLGALALGLPAVALAIVAFAINSVMVLYERALVTPAHDVIFWHPDPSQIEVDEL